MAYIGNTVENQGFTPAIDYFNGNGVTVTFTLSRPIASVAQVIVAIDNVIQNPSSSFTIAGNAITFSSAPLSGTNNIWVEYTSLITTYQAISQDPTVIGDIRATGGYLAEGDFGNSFVDGVILDYVTGLGRITVGSAEGIALYNGGTSGRNALLTLGATGQVAVNSSGSAATPVISKSDDLNTGIFFPAADTIAFTEGGAEAMRINSSGQVGIGTTSPSNPLHIVNSSANVNLLNLVCTNTYTGTGLAGEGPFRLQNTNTTNGNMTTISNYDGNGNINTQVNFINTDQAGSGAIGFTTRTGGSYAERMRITEGGGTRFQCQNFAAQPSATNQGVEINNTNSGSTFFGGGTGTETHLIFGNTNGVRGTIQTTSGGTSYNTTSDYRLKENIAPMTGALAKVSQLKPVNYSWKVDGSDGQGFIAHELQEVVPDAVTGEKDAVDDKGDPKYQMVDTSYLVATLTAAIQEQQTLITSLTARIAALEAK